MTLRTYKTLVSLNFEAQKQGLSSMDHNLYFYSRYIFFQELNTIIDTFSFKIIKLKLYY